METARLLNRHFLPPFRKMFLSDVSTSAVTRIPAHAKDPVTFRDGPAPRGGEGCWSLSRLRACRGNVLVLM
jgi:hypothetical protein